MKMKSSVALMLALGFISVGAQAMNFKAVVFTAEEIVDLLKRGTASARSLVDVEFYRSSPTKHALFGSIKRAGKSDVHILVSREKGEEGVDLIKVNLVSLLGESVTFKDVNRAFSLDDVARSFAVDKTSVTMSALLEDGPGIMAKLAQAEPKLVYFFSGPTSAGIESMRAIRASGADIKKGLGTSIFLEHTQGLHYIKNLGDAGHALSFEIRMIISDSTTPEELLRVMKMISEGPEAAF